MTSMKFDFTSYVRLKQSIFRVKIELAKIKNSKIDEISKELYNSMDIFYKEMNENLSKIGLFLEEESDDQKEILLNQDSYKEIDEAIDFFEKAISEFKIKLDELIRTLEIAPETKQDKKSVSLLIKELKCLSKNCFNVMRINAKAKTLLGN